MNLLSLIFHSLTIISVFKEAVIVRSFLFVLVYLFLIFTNISFINLIPIFGIIFGTIWLLVYLISKYSSLASIIGSISVPIYILLMSQNNVIFYLIMFVLIFYTHRENIKRLINKEENKTKIY